MQLTAIGTGQSIVPCPQANFDYSYHFPDGHPVRLIVTVLNDIYHSEQFYGQGTAAHFSASELATKY